MAAYYWINQGRLGNLLFQYAAILRNTSEGDRVYSFHNEVFSLLDIDQRFQLVWNDGRRAHQLSYIVNWLSGKAASARLLSSLKAEHIRMRERFLVESSTITKTHGLIRPVCIVDGFFQLGGLCDTPVRIKKPLLDLVYKRLLPVTNEHETVAVHIRLTDYVSWRVLGVVGTMLAPEWYRDRMDDFRRRLNSPRFIIFSDDIPATKELRLGEDLIYYQGKTALEDFAAMASCAHVILSPSTFAWWSAFAFRSESKIIMAPRYWAGFKSNLWYPPSIETPGVEYYPAK